MIWVEVTYESVLAHLPTDVRARYADWVQAFPDKSDRLETITGNTIREFRDAIKSNPANSYDPRESWLPQSAVRHAESIIIFTLAMDMGIAIDTSGNSARNAADVFLRQIPFGRWNTKADDDGALPSPRFTVPERSEGGRALPAVIALVLMCLPAFGGWIKQETTIFDWRISPTYAPAHYTNTTATLYGHLQGIDALFGAIASADHTFTNVVTLSGLPAQTIVPPYIPPPQAITGRLDIDGVIIGKNDDFNTEVQLRPRAVAHDLKLRTLSRTGSPGNAGDILLAPGVALTGGTSGAVRVQSDLHLSGKFWISTNSYLSANDTANELWFHTLSPATATRIAP